MHAEPPNFSNALSLTNDEWIRFLGGDPSVKVKNLAAPTLPPSKLQEAFVGSSGIAALEEAGAFYAEVMSTLRNSGNDPSDVGRVLDFGCGWGRIYRLFLRNCSLENLIGVDIDADCIRTCREEMPYGTFQAIDSGPPLDLEDGSFDIVVAYSVFSHLAEPLFSAWMSEFARILRPGKFLFFTTLKTQHLAVWADLAASGNVWYQAALREAGFSVRKWRRRARRGEFLFVPIGGGGVRESSFYGEAVVTQRYLQQHARRLGLTPVAITEDVLPQTLVVLQKPGGEEWPASSAPIS